MDKGTATCAPPLAELVLEGGRRSVSVVGLAKNVGKTTTLNHLIDELGARRGLRLGISSAGWDGEACDSITRTAKPRIVVPRGAVVATTTECLARAELAYTVLERTGMRTGMGEVQLVEAQGAGRVEVAGPSTISLLTEVRDAMLRLGCLPVILDGAINRKASSSASVCDAVILATGMNAGYNVADVRNLTAFWVELFTLPRVPVELQFTERPGFAALADGEGKLVDEAPLALLLQEGAYEGVALVALPGAVTDETVEALDLAGCRADLVAMDHTRLFLSPPVLRAWKKGGRRVLLRATCPLLGVTVNPTSVSGSHVEPLEFLATMAGACAPLPAWDVVLGRSIMRKN